MGNETESEKRASLSELRKLRSVCLFAGGAAHDYNNALTAVMGNISLARLEAEGNTELMELLRDAEKAAGRIKLMTEKIALYARGIKINKRKSNIGDIVNNTISSSTADYKGSSAVNIKDDFTDVEIDPDLISEALECVLENACEASEGVEGSIKVSVKREEVISSEMRYVDGVADGSYIKISVKDNGSGFYADHAVKLFEPYFSTKEGREGIGLALAYSILKRHRGFISAELPAEGGSLFSLYIPLF